MYKLVTLFAVVAVCAAAPKPYLYAAAPAVVPVAHVVPAVSTYSAYSTSVVHPPTVPVVHHTPLVHTPVVHSVHLAYAADTVLV